MNNGCTGQLKGPFKANQDLYSLIEQQSIKPISAVSHIGVQTDIKNYININGNDIEIGKTGIYEIGNTKITSLYFLQDVDNNTLIDYTIEF